jgi:hypothetical protein
MGILTINAMNVEGQGGTAASTRAASSSQANVDFATELDRKLQVKTSPTPTSDVSEPKGAPGTGNLSKNGTASHQAAGPSTVSLDITVTAGSVAASNSTDDNKPTPSLEQAATPQITSTLVEVPPDNNLNAPSANRAVPTEAASSLQSSPPAQALATGQHSSASVAGPKVASANNATPVEASSTSLPSRLAQASATGQNSSPSVAGPKVSSANNATPVEASSTSLPSRLAQALATGQNSSPSVAGPKVSSANNATPVEASSTSLPSRLAQASATGQHGSASVIGPEVSSANNATPAEASSTSLPSRLAQASATGQQRSAVAGAMSERPDALNATSSSRSSKRSQGAAVATPVPSQDVTTQLGLQEPSGGANPKADPSESKDSKAYSANQARPAEASSTGQPTPRAQTFAAGQHESADVAGSTPEQMDALDAAGPGRPSKGSQNAAVETLPSLQDVTAQVGLQVPSNGPDPKAQPNGLQAAGTETKAPLHQSTTQFGPQDPSSGPEARTRPAAESSPESPSRAQNSTDPKVQISTVDPVSPDLSLPMPFELTKAASTGRVDHPQDPNRIRNSQEGNHTAAGTFSDAPPDAAPESPVQGPAQTQDVALASSAHDAKQADASTGKKSGEAAPDFTKVADEKGNLPKTSADAPLAPQLTPQGRAEAGRASPEAAAASPGRGEADGASALPGHQANAPAAVSSARFAQQAGNAEMQVRLRTETLGPIDVHTTVKGSDIGASIRVEARDTQVMLANELSQLERALNERSLRVERLDVLQGSVSGGQSNGSDPGNSYGSPSEPRPNYASHSAGQTYPSVPEAPTLLEDGGLGLSTTRINLRV